MRFSRILIFLSTFVFGLFVKDEPLGKTALGTQATGSITIGTLYSTDGRIVKTLSDTGGDGLEPVQIKNLFNAISRGGDQVSFNGKSIDGPFYAEYLKPADIKTPNRTMTSLSHIAKEEIGNLIASLSLGAADDLTKRLMTLYWIYSCLSLLENANKEVIKRIVQDKLNEDPNLRAAFGIMNRTNNNQDFHFERLAFTNNQEIIDFLNKADWGDHKYAVSYCILLSVNPADLPRLRNAFRLDAMSDEGFKTGWQAVVKSHLNINLSADEKSLLYEFDLRFAASHVLNFGQFARRALSDMFGYPIWCFKVNRFPWRTLVYMVCNFVLRMFMGFALVFVVSGLLMILTGAHPVLTMGFVLNMRLMIISSVLAALTNLILCTIDSIYNYNQLLNWRLPNVDA